VKAHATTYDVPKEAATNALVHCAAAKSATTRSPVLEGTYSDSPLSELLLARYVPVRNDKYCSVSASVPFAFALPRWHRLEVADSRLMPKCAAT